MGLIINKSIKKLMTGYPTVSDKYDVQGGLLGGTADAKFGDLLVFDATAEGTFKVPTTAISNVADIAGLVVAQNVKLATVYPATNASVVFKPGEAINLLLKGYIAVELDSGATVADIKDGAKVACLLATGKLTTSGTTNATDVPAWFFTGIYENQGTIASPKYVAEICIKY